MAGDCFWTALVNCFDDCGAAPPPAPAAALREDFETLPTARAPSGGPSTFTSSVNANLAVADGSGYSTSPTAAATVTLSGGFSYLTEETRTFRAGLKFDEALVNSYVSVAFTVREQIELNNPQAISMFSAEFYADGSVYIGNAYTEVLEYDEIEDTFTTLTVADGGDSSTSADVWSAGAEAVHELRLEVSASHYRAYIGSTLLLSATWSGAPLTRPMTPALVILSLSRPGVGVDYVQLDLDE